jgi:2,3-bisphosphoglycerate-dependent phosphoglycerate mutase
MGPTTATSSLVLVRHGETNWNADRRVQGHADESSLTETGRLQARQLAAGFGTLEAGPVRALYSSDLQRSRSTAEPLSARLGLPVRVDVRLRERRFGVVEGHPLSVVTAETTGISEGRVVDPDAHPEGGESIRDLYRRAASFLDDLLATHEAGDVVAVSHGGTIRVALAYLDGVPVDQMTWLPVPNTAAYRRPLERRGRTAPTTGPHFEEESRRTETEDRSMP